MFEDLMWLLSRKYSWEENETSKTMQRMSRSTMIRKLFKAQKEKQFRVEEWQHFLKSVRNDTQYKVQALSDRKTL